MLPPIESSVLVANPKFEVLYSDLCANKLNENGSSKLDVKAQKERDVLRQELYRIRLEDARREVIRASLEDSAYRDDSLPDDLRELVALAAAMLGGEVWDEDSGLVNAELESFNNLQSSTSTSQIQLDRSRLALAGNIKHFHALQRQILESSIRILEQTIHGSVARSTKSKTEYLATVAEGMNKKVGLQHAQLMQLFYSTDVQEALRNQADTTRMESTTLRAKVRDAEGKLEEYRAAKGMLGIAKEYAEILKVSEKVKEEISRL
ncbi:hypothetical protein LTR91_019160 [Friedmanniomyces endolithicus]|uniref:Uncharacterized protein n=1 Tax=Friedmanniomyces endolithicus TaxID=329885 RepID=A0AAN6HFE5_9PEZI|nr:hypothetical protein LTR94_012981 [Friedmanniomyces endolithicus]KAK0773146.1 hypothetical protein LTR75_017208 [Friedmanniomyces endolithicus]KAK0790954.1 hypothetical protein LTR59_009034 [Friedmanniomyces endolithicus]KAK0797145.1 hypothetical protein LTR38_008281 [Friedmanniomyces endolithicus]KAK0837908.1 hypothetical protein LTR03_012447 [Friedmanniomyces endolithicus]